MDPATAQMQQQLQEMQPIMQQLQQENEQLKTDKSTEMQRTQMDGQKAQAEMQLKQGDQALKAAGNGQMDVRTLTPGALNAVRAWRKAAEHFHALNTPSSLWDALSKTVESWNLLAQDKLAPVENGRRIVVFDTSALMESPELFQDLSSDDIPVVPHRVLSELDGLKSSEDGDRAAKAREAIRQLDANSSCIRHETEYAALLPVEWDVKQPDHAILSTALFFRLNDVLFVSNDINLRNKANSLGLKTQDSNIYGPSRLVPANSPKMHPRKQNNRKRRK